MSFIGSRNVLRKNSVKIVIISLSTLLNTESVQFIISIQLFFVLYFLNILITIDNSTKYIKLKYCQFCLYYDIDIIVILI